MKIGRVLPILKLIFGSLALVEWLAHAYLYRVYVDAGNSVASSESPVEVNVHGSIVFITKAQDQNLTSLAVAVFSTFAIAILIDLYLRKSLSKR